MRLAEVVCWSVSCGGAAMTMGALCACAFGRRSTGWSDHQQKWSGVYYNNNIIIYYTYRYAWARDVAAQARGMRLINVRGQRRAPARHLRIFYSFFIFFFIYAAHARAKRKTWRHWVSFINSPRRMTTGAVQRWWCTTRYVRTRCPRVNHDGGQELCSDDETVTKTH